MRKSLFNAAEMIRYLEPKLGDELCKVFDKIKEVVDDKLLDNKGLLEYFSKSKGISLDSLLSSIIKDHTGLNVEVLLHSNIAGAIMVFPFNRNHTFLKEYVRDKYYIKNETKILKESKDHTGTVDLKNGKVSGIFTKYEHTLFLDIRLTMVTYAMTARELTAIVLHELGHAFTYYEYSNRLATTNRLLADLAEKSRDYDPEKRTYIFKELGYNLQLSNAEVEDLYNSNDGYILGPKLFKVYISKVDGLRKITKYDETTSESLADNFAVRQGYGKDLVTGLDKLYKFEPERNDLVLALFISTEIFFDFIILPALYISLIMAGSYIAAAVIIGFFILSLTSGNLNYKDMTYDNLKERYTRIEKGMINALKNRDLPKEQVASLIEQIEDIKNLISEVNVYVPIKDKLYNYLFFFSSGSSKEIAKDIKRQQELNDLGNNDLFITAAKLKHGL